MQRKKNLKESKNDQNFILNKVNNYKTRINLIYE